MKQTYIIALFTLLASLANAQVITTNDSAILGAGNAQMVFYQLSSGTKTAVNMDEWQVAITVRPTQFPGAPLGGTTMRINEAFGTHVYKTTALAAALTSNLDTTGWQGWLQLHDSDSVMDEGALNSERTGNIFDFGWGFYNQSSHNVMGDSLFLIQLPNGAVKKLLVTALIQDTAFHIQYADVDGSNVQDVYISKASYAGKNFVYLDLTNNTVHDFEPMSSDWDLLFLKYTALDVQPGTPYGVVGVWQNNGAQTWEALNGISTSDNHLNAIGWDWKYYDNISMSYTMIDSLEFFIAPAGTADLSYRIIFTGYSGSNTGIVRFYKQEIISGISDVPDEAMFSLYPNPTTDKLNLVMKEKASAQLQIEVVDMSGRVVLQEQAATQHALITTALQNGMYLLRVRTGTAVAQRRFIVAH